MQRHFGAGLDPSYRDDGSVIPPWGHLWLNRAEMGSVFARRNMSAQFTARVLDWIYEASTVSRKTYSEVDAAFAAAAARRGARVVWSSCQLEGASDIKSDALSIVT